MLETWVLQPHRWPAEPETLVVGPAIWVSVRPPGGESCGVKKLLWACVSLKPGAESHVPRAGFVHHRTPADIAIQAQSHLKWLCGLSPGRGVEGFGSVQPRVTQLTFSVCSGLLLHGPQAAQATILVEMYRLDRFFSTTSCTPRSLPTRSPAPFETIIMLNPAAVGFGGWGALKQGGAPQLQIVLPTRG